MTSLSFPSLLPLLTHVSHASFARMQEAAAPLLLDAIKDRFLTFAKGVAGYFKSARDGYAQSKSADAIDPLYDPPEAAEYLGIKESTLAVWRCVGRYGIEYVKVGRLVKYRKSALDAFLERRTRSQVGQV